MTKIVIIRDANRFYSLTPEQAFAASLSPPLQALSADSLSVENMCIPSELAYKISGERLLRT